MPPIYFVPKQIAEGKGAGRAANHIHLFDHFMGPDPVNAVYWTVNGTGAGDAPAIVSNQEGGIIALDPDSAGAAESNLVYELNYQPASQGFRMYAEAKVRFTVSSALARFMVGFSDSTAIETPMALDAAGAITASVATDAAVMIFDTDQTTDVVRLASVDTDLDQTTVDTGITIVAGEWYIFRVEINAAGTVFGSAFAYDDQIATGREQSDQDRQEFRVGADENTVGITPTVLLTPGIWSQENGGGEPVEVDYFRFGGVVVA